RHKAWVVQGCCVTSLAHEPGAEGGIDRILRTEYLDRDLAPEDLVAPAPYRRHPADSDHIKEHISAGEPARALHCRSPVDADAVVAIMWHSPGALAATAGRARRAAGPPRRRGPGSARCGPDRAPPPPSPLPSAPRIPHP